MTLQCLLPGGCHLSRAGLQIPLGSCKEFPHLIMSLFPFFLDFSWRYMPDPTLTWLFSALRHYVADQFGFGMIRAGSVELGEQFGKEP